MISTLIAIIFSIFLGPPIASGEQGSVAGEQGSVVALSESGVVHPW